MIHILLIHLFFYEHALLFSLVFLLHARYCNSCVSMSVSNFQSRSVKTGLHFERHFKTLTSNKESAPGYAVTEKIKKKTSVKTFFPGPNVYEDYFHADRCRSPISLVYESEAGTRCELCATG